MKHAVKLIHFVGGPRVPTKNLVVREGLHMKHAVKLIHFVEGPRVPTKNLVVREGCA